MIYVEVFPEGRDSTTGELETTQFKFNEFNNTIKKVASECNWNIDDEIEDSLRTVSPGAPYTE